MTNFECAKVNKMSSTEYQALQTIESDIKHPKTSCVKRPKSNIACDDYIKADGKKDYACCESCGWNNVVASKRLMALRQRLGMEVC